MKGSTFKRCGCRDESGKQLGVRCPKLNGRGHGSWWARFDVPPAAGREIEALFQVSTATARRDIDDLARRHLALRVHGGAVLPRPVPDLTMLDISGP